MPVGVLITLVPGRGASKSMSSNTELCNGAIINIAASIVTYFIFLLPLFYGSGNLIKLIYVLK